MNGKRTNRRRCCPATVLLLVLLSILFVPMEFFRKEVDATNDNNNNNNNNNNNTSSGGLIEYCEGHSFIARCPNRDDIILMQSAYYGRMRIGRCLAVTSGSRCQEDILDQFDVWCSGQRSCEVRVSSIIDYLPDTSLTCLRDYRGYLEASYICVKAVFKSKEDCHQKSVADVSLTGLTSGYLASVMTEETGCGSLETPWLLRASPGQTIKLTLYDFAFTNRDRDQLVRQVPRVCQVYAVIKERLVRSSETVCGSENRETVVFTSVTNQLEVRMVASTNTVVKKSQKNIYYMFRYDVSGCPDLQPPLGGWVIRSGDVVSFRCNGTDERWQVNCENGQWIGQRKNCSSAASFWKEDSESTDAGLIWSIFTGAAMVIILGIAVVIGLIIFFVGLIYLKRRRPCVPHGARSCGAGCSSPRCLPDYHLAQQCSDPGVLQTSPGSKSLQSTTTRSNEANYSTAENDYFRTWQLQRQAPPGPACSGSGTNGSTRFTVLRACPGGQFHDPSSTAGGRRVVVEHIYESPKFERRDMMEEPEGMDAPCHPPPPPIAPLQYHELDDPRVMLS